MTGVTDSEGMIWQSYRYDANGSMTFGQPQYNNVYSYNAESYNPNMDAQYLRARYYNVAHANFLTEDSYLGNITDPLTLNRYNYVKSSPLNYIDPSGHSAGEVLKWGATASEIVALLDGPLPGYADAAGAIILGGSAIVAGGMVIYDGITYIGDQISQAKAKKKTGDCQEDDKKEKAKGESEDNLPENTTDAGKKGSKEWNDAKKKIKNERGKGVNTKTPSQEAAEELLNEARPELEKKPTYSKDGKSGYEIHPAEPDVGNNKPHIKWWDWSNGKANGAEGHIYFD